MNAKSTVGLHTEGNLQRSKNINIHLLTAIFVLLLSIGVINLYSASLGNQFFYSQLKFVTLSTGMFFIFGWLVPTKYLNAYSYLFYGFVILLLLVVLIIGYTAGGSTRWIRLGFLGGQPSELAKLAVALVVARFFYTNRLAHSYFLRDLWPVLLMIGIIFGFIFEQPDLGTAGICLLIALAQLCFVRIDLRSIGVAAFCAFIIAAAGWNLFLHDYQKLRVINLLNPNFDPQGTGYNSLQSLVAIGSGGLFGKGFMQGTQTQLQFLPARHTDFVFSVFAEEHGFWGASLVFILFCCMTLVALEIARQTRDVFQSLLAVGICALIFIEFAINTAMVIGIFPIVGLPLPFFSAGGSSLITVSIGLGILVAIHRETLSRQRIDKTITD